MWYKCPAAVWFFKWFLCLLLKMRLLDLIRKMEFLDTFNQNRSLLFLCVGLFQGLGARLFGRFCSGSWMWWFLHRWICLTRWIAVLLRICSGFKTFRAQLRCLGWFWLLQDCIWLLLEDRRNRFRFIMKSKEMGKNRSFWRNNNNWN